MHIVYLVKKTSWILWLLSISAALNIGLNLLLIPRLGILGAAVATLIAYAVLGILAVIISFRYLKFDLDFPFIAKSIVASVIMALAIWLLNPISITWVIISILLGVFVYFAIMFAFKGFDKKELALLKGLVSGSDSKGE